MKLNWNRELKDVLMTFVAALLSVVALHTFVVPADFSPSGIDGACTILYEITGVNMGWFKILINIPLMVLAWIFLNKKYVLYVMFFTVLDSVGVIILESISFFVFIPTGLTVAEAVGYRLLAAIFSGVMLGVCVGIMLKLGYSSGGVDIIACLVHKWKSHFNVERVISVCAYTIVGISYFVYWDLTSILLSVVQIYVSEWTIAGLLRRERFAIEVKVVTKEPEKIRDEILYKHRHSATIVESKGMYSNEKNYMVVSVMNSRDIPEFMNSMKKHPDTFVYFSDGVRVQGDFHFTHEKIGERIDAYQ
ncbi:MAG: YitT family protein [Clostridia bacterium]|nr:YitT family protein [Clostridia bacterium]